MPEFLSQNMQEIEFSALGCKQQDLAACSAVVRPKDAFGFVFLLGPLRSLYSRFSSWCLYSESRETRSLTSSSLSVLEGRLGCHRNWRSMWQWRLKSSIWSIQRLIRSLIALSDLVTAWHKSSSEGPHRYMTFNPGSSPHILFFLVDLCSSHTYSRSECSPTYLAQVCLGIFVISRIIPSPALTMLISHTVHQKTVFNNS